MAEERIPDPTEPRCNKCDGPRSGNGRLYCKDCEAKAGRERRARIRESGRSTPCFVCEGMNFTPGGDCRDCARRNRLAKTGPCPKCGGTERNSSNICARCQRTRSKKWADRAREGQRPPCAKCGGSNFFPAGACRDCRARWIEERNADPEKLKAKRAWHRDWAAERRKEEKHLVHSRMSTNVYMSLRQYAKTGKNRASWTALVGYGLPELIAHLKTTLPAGYTWDDYLAGKLHIDHEVPVAVFNFHSPQCEDFKRLWRLSNLQLLPGGENMSKGAKLAAPFQPSLI